MTHDVNMAGFLSHRLSGGVVGALLAATALGLALPAPALAQRLSGATDARTGAIMNVPVDKSQVLRVDRAFAKAVVGNSDVADVLPLSASSVYVLGKKIGSTNLSLYDRAGGLIAVVDVIVGPDTMGLKRKLSELMPTEQIGVAVSNDTLVLSGRVSSPVAAETAASLAETYAPKKVLNMMTVGSPQQVLLEVRFSEMTRGTVKQLGINQVSWGSSFTGGGVITGNRDTSNSPYQAAFGFLGTGLNIQIDALEREGLVHTLAQPNLVALSGETANFLAGGEFPVPVSASASSGSGLPTVSIEFKQFGVSLAFTPTVLQDGLINLVVAPEVSELDQAAGVILNGFNIPGLKVRRAKTSLELRDGQSFAIAGLIQSDFTDTVRRIPLLGNVPIIGALFRSTNFKRNETELVIVVTPRIVRPVTAGSLSYPTDRVVPPSDSDLFLLGKSERRVPLSQLPPGAPKPGGIEGDYGHIVR